MAAGRQHSSIVHCLFHSFYAVIRFKIIIIVIQVMFLRINMFLALLRTRFNPRYTLGSKYKSESGKNIFIPSNITCIVVVSCRRFFSGLYKLFKCSVDCKHKINDVAKY